MLLRDPEPKLKTASHLRLYNVALAGMNPYTTQNSVPSGLHDTAYMGPSLPVNINNVSHQVGPLGHVVINMLVYDR